MKYAVMMLLAGSVSASSQILAPESQSMWSVSMDNQKFKEIKAQDEELGQEIEKFHNSHPMVKAEAKQLKKMFHRKITKLSKRLQKTGKMLENQKYQAEIQAIVAKVQALDLKIKKALKIDAQGLKMWKLHMNNKKFKQIAADDQVIKQDVEKFINSHPKVGAELKELSADIQADFNDIGQRLQKTGKMLGDPKYKMELGNIESKFKALDKKFKANLHWDDQGLKMWKLSMDPKVDQEIKQGLGEVSNDFENLERPGQKLAAEFQKYQMDQELNAQQIAGRIDQAIYKLDTPAHKAQLQKIATRWNKLQMYVNKEEQAILMDLQAFVQQPSVQGELNDLQMDVSKEINEMDMRFKKFQMEIENPSNEIGQKLDEIAGKLEALDYKFKNNLKFDPETKMWKVSMDNKVTEELKKDDALLKKDIEKFINSNDEIKDEVDHVGHHLQNEMQEVQGKLMESAKLLEKPEYKAELEAIAAKMKALDAKIKANIKFEQ